MNKMLKISEAAAIAIHACALLAGKNAKRIDARQISKTLDISYDHLSKVLQRLSKAHIVKSVKGPGGGFELARDPSKLYLKEVYEVIEGPMQLDKCLFGREICSAKKCILGNLISGINKEVTEYFTRTKVSDIQL